LIINKKVIIFAQEIDDPMTGIPFIIAFVVAVLAMHTKLVLYFRER